MISVCFCQSVSLMESIRFSLETQKFIIWFKTAKQLSISMVYL